MNEKIICAACYYPDGKQYSNQPQNIDNGYVVAGWRHHNCISIAGLIQQDLPTEEFLNYRRIEIQGFLTSDGNFVDREEAARCAYIQNQISAQVYHSKRELYSEDLY